VFCVLCLFFFLFSPLESSNEREGKNCTGAVMLFSVVGFIGLWNLDWSCWANATYRLLLLHTPPLSLTFENWKLGLNKLMS
jgi:hypothetical protein